MDMFAWTTEILRTEVFANDLLNRATRFGTKSKIESSICSFEGAERRGAKASLLYFLE